MADHDPTGLLAMTTGIIANFVANNRVSPDELPGLVTLVHGSLSRLGDAAPEEAEPEAYEMPTAVQIRRSITDDGLISFIDGKPYKTLKRHLSRHAMTPQDYRQRFGLKADYPMTAPSYSMARSVLAKAAGLGLGGRQPKKAERGVRMPRTPKG